MVNLLDNENAKLATEKMKELGADPMLLPALMKLAARYDSEKRFFFFKSFLVTKSKKFVKLRPLS